MLVALAKRLGLNRSRALYYIYHRYLCRDPHPLNTPRRDVILGTDGQKFLVANPTESRIGRAIFDHGVWEPQATRFICPRIRPGMTVVDVGAHTGYYTILFAKRVGPTGRVLAIEPEKRALTFLHRNVEMNGYDNVTVLPIALSNRVAGVAELDDAFYVPDDGTAPPEDQSDAAAAVFDDLVESLELQRLDLVKIDVEGAELHVLEGMTRSLANWAPDILLEVHPSRMANCGRSVSQLETFLADQGYETQPVSGPSESGVYTVYCVSRVRTTSAARPATSVAPSVSWSAAGTGG